MRRKWRDLLHKQPSSSKVLYALVPEERGEFAGLVKAALHAQQLANAYLADIIKREGIPDDSIWDGQERVFRVGRLETGDLKAAH